MLLGKRFLPGDGNAHLEERADEHAVAGLAAGAVGRRNVDVEVVDKYVGSQLGFGVLQLLRSFAFLHLEANPLITDIH
jgi:hypothetical protein